MAKNEKSELSEMARNLIEIFFWGEGGIFGGPTFFFFFFWGGGGFWVLACADTGSEDPPWRAPVLVRAKCVRCLCGVVDRLRGKRSGH
jgi:hypothetical protein